MSVEDIGIRFLVVGLGELRRSVGTARDDINSLERTVRTVSGATSTWGETLTRIGGAMVGFGRTMSLFVTTPLSILTGSLINAGVKFEDTFAGISKTVDGVAVGFDEIAAAAQDRLGITITTMDQAKDAAQDMGMAFGDLTPVGEQMRADFRELALAIPIPIEELNKLGEMLGALGVSAQDLPEVTKLVAELGVATDLTAEEAAKGLVKMFNIVGEEGASLVDFLKSAGAALVDLGNNSVSTEGEILNIGMRLAAAGDRAEFSVPQLLAWSTTIADVGSRSEAGGSAVSRAINEMILAVQTGSENLGTFASVAGVSVDKFSQLFKEDASNALLLFISNLNEGIKSGRVTKDMLNDMGLGGIRAVDILGRLSEASSLFGKNLDISNQAWEEQIALEEEAEKRFATVESQIQILKNTFADLGITVFDLVKDDLLNLIASIKSILGWFKNLSPTTQKMILTIAGIAAAIGPVLIVAGAMISMFGTLVTIFGALATPVGIAALAIGGIALALGSLIGWDTIIGGIEQAFKDLEVPASGVLGIVEDLLAQKASIQDLWTILQGKTPTGAGEQTGNIANVPTHAAPINAVPTESAENIQRLQDNVAKLGIPVEFITGLQSVLDFITKIAQEFSSGFMTGLQPFLDMAGPKLEEIFANLKNIDLGPMFEALGVTLEKIDWEGLGETIGTVAGLILTNLLDGLNILVKDVIPLLITGITDTITVFGDLFQIISDAFSGASAEQMQANVDKLGKDIIEGTKRWLEGLLQTFEDIVMAIINEFWILYGELVGHSIIPDLVTDILSRLVALKDGAIQIFGELASKAAEALAKLFGGGEEASGPALTMNPEQIAAMSAALATVQTQFTTMLTTMKTQFDEFVVGLRDTFVNMPIWFQLALDLIVAALGGFVTSMAARFIELQNTAVAAFTTMGTSASAAFAGTVIASMSGLVTGMTAQMLYLDEYWLETVRHMVGHWLDFKAATEALTSDWVTNTIASFDTVHNQSVGKMHLIRDAWTKDSVPDMMKGNDQLSNSIGSSVFAFGKLAGAASGAASAVWGAAQRMIAAMEAVQAAATGSPELKIHHSFERFENYLKGTDFGAIIEGQMAMPSFMTEVAPVMPAVVGGNTTTINRNVSTGDIVGSSLDSQDAVVDTMLRVIRTEEALSS